MQDHSLPIGTSLASHTVERVLGQGGFGITYQVRDPKGQLLAIKEYFPAHDADRTQGTVVHPKPGHEKRFKMGYHAFLDEARTLNALPKQQRGLVRIEGAFEKNATVYALMEFIDGETLDQASRMVLRKYAHIPIGLLQDFASSILEALHMVHQVGVVHRDIKPANIMLRQDGHPVLIDFGAAQPMQNMSSKAAMFSKRYAALEQFPPNRTGYRPSRREHGAAIDVFGLSVTLYELVSQSLPQDAKERFAAFKSTGRDPYLPVRENMRRHRVQAQYPDVLLDTIDAGCALLPEHRLGSAREMALRLQGFADVGLRASPSCNSQSGAQTGSQSRQRPSSRRAGQPSQRPASPAPSNTANKGRPAPKTLPSSLLVAMFILLLAAVSVGFGMLTK